MSTPERQAHWQNVYQTKGERDVSWFEESPTIYQRSGVWRCALPALRAVSAAGHELRAFYGMIFCASTFQYRCAALQQFRIAFLDQVSIEMTAWIWSDAAATNPSMAHRNLGHHRIECITHRLDELWTVVSHDDSPDPARGFPYSFSPVSHEAATSHVSEVAIF